MAELISLFPVKIYPIPIIMKRLPFRSLYAQAVSGTCYAKPCRAGVTHWPAASSCLPANLSSISCPFKISSHLIIASLF